MKLEYKIKPITKKYNSRPSPYKVITDMSGFSNPSYQIGKTHSGWIKRDLKNDAQYFYGIRMEKHRKKCIKREKVSKTKNMDMTQQCVSNKYTYERAYWLVHLYVIPISVLSALGLCANQHSMKTFTIKPIKRT